jgi:hypothetical protein
VTAEMALPRHRPVGVGFFYRNLSIIYRGYGLPAREGVIIL